MAPLPENSTARLFVIQTGPHGEHVTLMRFGPAVSSAEAVAAARAICVRAAALTHNSTAFSRARWSAKGEEVSFPVPWGASIPGLLGEAFGPEEYPNFFSLVGRSVDGRRVRMTFFGQPSLVHGDYRYQRGDGGSVAALLDHVQAANPPVLTISESIPIWNDYLNLGVNAYYQRKRRRTG